jgi:translation initiation factor IF-3
VKADLDAYGLVEQFPKLEGRQMVMVLAPKKKVPLTKPKKETVKQDAPKPAPKQAAKPAAA